MSIVVPPERPQEFDCIECERHIVNLANPIKGPLICAACTCMPGWNSVPELRERIDPEHHALWIDNPPEPGTLRWQNAQGKNP